MFLARMFLLLAIVAEVAGTSTMNFISNNDAIWGYLVMYLLIAISYYFLSLAAKQISIGVAYAIWEGLGISLITVVSLFLFDSDLNAQQLVGLGLAVVGIVCVTLGEPHHGPKVKEEKN
ncbi:QacE family quaternary ammonium compound efflux SMR transporter [Vibrio sinensis]|uniref:Spermidine export protein MdtJ n=1 Tax=Vibrio sinensis TaxID=2302434 RepID=A0A3A6QA59_9VIBR|nr:SMR family transporter [Vibrio sinensis]RJX68809.1 QacE family quaternary ammonium compound efflux SMR transporter [Vibrio sinensis]